MGFIYETGQTVPQDYSKAREYYELAANLGHAKSQHNLALLCSDGSASRKMHGKAREWYEKATTQGLADSQFNLGTMYFLGEGGEKNESFAR